MFRLSEGVEAERGTTRARVGSVSSIVWEQTECESVVAGEADTGRWWWQRERGLVAGAYTERKDVFLE